MKYKPEVKSEVIDLYRGGMPRRRISESQGIPLPTVRSWTQDIVSAEATQIKCVVCGKKKRTLNIKQVYCSVSCKNRVNYQRRRQRQVVVPDMRICQHCGKQYQPRHGNAIKYCGTECRNKASVGRLKRSQVQSQVRSEKEHFDRCVKCVLQARKEASDMKIDREQYRSELDTIAEYFTTHKRSFSHQAFDTIQQIFQSVK